MTAREGCTRNYTSKNHGHGLRLSTTILVIENHGGPFFEGKIPLFI